MSRNTRRVAIVRAADEIAPKFAAALVSGVASAFVIAVIEYLTHSPLPGILSTAITLLCVAAGGYIKADTVPSLAATLRRMQEADPVGFASADSATAQIVEASEPAWAAFEAQVRAALPAQLVDAALNAGPAGAVAMIQAQAATQNAAPVPAVADEVAPDPDSIPVDTAPREGPKVDPDARYDAPAA